MSHFTVLVIGEDYEDQLAPFYEQGDENDDFMEHQIEVAVENMEAKARELAKDEGNPAYAGMVQQGKFKEVCESYYGGLFDEEGNLYYLSNPNAQWDWYVLGGRWRGYFKLKPGKQGILGESGTGGNQPKYDADQALKGDIDWEGMKKDKLEKARETWDTFEIAVQNGTIKGNDAYWNYGIEKDDDEDSYIARQSSNATFAVLKDGEWYEQGNMGWFGVVLDEKDQGQWNDEFDKLIESLPDETLLTVVDCHI